MARTSIVGTPAEIVLDPKESAMRCSPDDYLPNGTLTEV